MEAATVRCCECAMGTCVQWAMREKVSQTPMCRSRYYHHAHGYNRNRMPSQVWEHKHTSRGTIGSQVRSLYSLSHSAAGGSPHYAITCFAIAMYFAIAMCFTSPYLVDAWMSCGNRDCQFGLRVIGECGHCLLLLLANRSR
jgi:hypothetical protein